MGCEFSIPTKNLREILQFIRTIIPREKQESLFILFDADEDIVVKAGCKNYWTEQTSPASFVKSKGKVVIPLDVLSFYNYLEKDVIFIVKEFDKEVNDILIKSGISTYVAVSSDEKIVLEYIPEKIPLTHSFDFKTFAEGLKRASFTQHFPDSDKDEKSSTKDKKKELKIKRKLLLRTKEKLLK